jgi:peptidoglycan/xylan/chitin deacetylase (PgdA/CDA1 family)
MKLVSPILRHVAYPLLSSSGYFRRCAGHGQLCVVTYHGVRPAGYVSKDAMLDGSLVTADALRAQIRLLQDRYSIVAPEDFLRFFREGTPLPERAVLLTCDDGLVNTVTDMLPVLRELGVACLFFVTGGSLTETPGMLWYEELKLMLNEAPDGEVVLRLGDTEWKCAAGGDRHAFWWSAVCEVSKRDARDRTIFLQQARKNLGLPQDWDRRYRERQELHRRFFLLSRNQLMQLQEQGMSVGAHSMSHPLLSKLSEEEARREIEESRTLLEKTLGRTVEAFAYPFGNPGSVTTREMALAEKAGFRCAFLNIGGGFGAGLPRYGLPRVHVTADMDHVSGFYRRLRGAPPIPVAAA